MDNSDKPANPTTPTRSRSKPVIPPFSPRTPLRKTSFQVQDDYEHMSIKDVTLASGASLIIRGVGANKKNSDPIQLMNETILKLKTNDPTLAPVIAKRFSTRPDWTTTCYVHIDPNYLSGSTETEPRTDLLQQWRQSLAAFNLEWDVSWMPAKYGQDKRMWVRFPDFLNTSEQEAAKEKLLQWAKSHNYMVCSSYFNKGGVTLNFAKPLDVDTINERGQITIKGFEHPVRVMAGRQIPIENPFELVVVGGLAEYEGLGNLIEQWVLEEFQTDGQSMLAGVRTPKNESQAYVFHMTTWADTARVLSPSSQAAFQTAFARYNLQPPQMLYKVNTDSAYMVLGNLREDFAKGADSMNKNLLTLTRRLDDMEQKNQQQHQVTQLQLTAVTTSLNTVTHALSGLENRVCLTQRAIIAQSRELMLSRNITDTSVSMLNLEMRILLENDPTKKDNMQRLLNSMTTEKKKLQNTIQNASNDFMAIVNSPIPQLTQAPVMPVPHATTSTLPAPPGLLQQAAAPATPIHHRQSGSPEPGPNDHDNSATKKRRIDTLNTHAQDSEPQEDADMSSCSEVRLQDWKKTGKRPDLNRGGPQIMWTDQDRNRGPVYGPSSF